MLTKSEAIRKHRLMWNWIGSMLKSGVWKNFVKNNNVNSMAIVVAKLKYCYLNMTNEKEMRSACYLCEYVVEKHFYCLKGEYCPIKWTSNIVLDDTISCSESYYGEFRRIPIFEKAEQSYAGDIAFKIANLPEWEESV